MKFIVKREQLLKPLQHVTNLLTNRPALPILGNILLTVTEENVLQLTGTDMEIEIIAKIALDEPCEPGEYTLPGRKLFDICRSLPNDSTISVAITDNRALVHSSRSRFSLATLPAAEFPNLDDWSSDVSFSLPQSLFKNLIESTQFSMAHQDVRYYLNGMLLETDGNMLRAVATDGHRLAVCTLPIDTHLPAHSVIVPRKGVLELHRLLNETDNTALLQIGHNNLRLHVDDIIFTSKLVDGSFPDYRRVLPKNPDKTLEAPCELLKQAFSRVAILSNEKFRGVRLYLENNQLKITANNPEQEEAEEIIDVTYSNDALEIGFNVSYLLDVLNILKCEQIQMRFVNATSSIQISAINSDAAIYIIMPMRL